MLWVEFVIHRYNTPRTNYVYLKRAVSLLENTICTIPSRGMTSPSSTLKVSISIRILHSHSLTARTFIGVARAESGQDHQDHQAADDDDILVHTGGRAPQHIINAIIDKSIKAVDNR
jgi:hypothetical protein